MLAGSRLRPVRDDHIRVPQRVPVGAVRRRDVGDAAAMVTVEFNEADRAWRSYCQACTTTQWYWFQPDLVEETASGDLVPVRRRGNLVYDYELASEQVPA